MGDLRSFFAAGKAAPIGNTRYASGCGLTQRRHPAVPPDTTLSPRPFPSGPTALGLRPLLSRPTQPPPRLTRKIRRPGTSFAREIRLNRKIHRPDPHSTRHPSCPALSRSALLHRHVSRPPPPRRNTCRASPLPPNGMPHEPRRGRPIQICRPDRMPRQKERQPAGAAALRQSDSGPIICC